MLDLRFDRVCKKYRIRRDGDAAVAGRGIAARLRNLRRRSEEFWALREVSFEVERGEALGVIGPNGAGKSTILKLLSHITAPTRGEIAIAGRLSALIEVGSGFHPELTGRENIFLSGAILGMRRREIQRKLDSIVEFAGVGHFVDTPVKRYSSGMYVRLGFAVAAHLESDILLLDEVLAVGDAAFQSKCFQRIAGLKEEGKTIVFISHDLAAVESVCDRALLVDRGALVCEGRPGDVIMRYHRRINESPAAAAEDPDRSRQPVRIRDVTLRDEEGRLADTFFTGGPLRLQVNYEAREAVADVVVEVFFYAGDGSYLCQYTTALDGERLDLRPGSATVEFSCRELELLPGFYFLDATIKPRGASNADSFDWQSRCAFLRVGQAKLVVGKYYAHHQWRVIEERETRAAARSMSPAALHAVGEE